MGRYGLRDARTFAHRASDAWRLLSRPSGVFFAAAILALIRVLRSGLAQLATATADCAARASGVRLHRVIASVIRALNSASSQLRLPMFACLSLAPGTAMAAFDAALVRCLAAGSVYRSFIAARSFSRETSVCARDAALVLARDSGVERTAFTARACAARAAGLLKCFFSEAPLFLEVSSLIEEAPRPPAHRFNPLGDTVHLCAMIIRSIARAASGTRSSTNTSQSKDSAPCARRARAKRSQWLSPRAASRSCCCLLASSDRLVTPTYSSPVVRSVAKYTSAMGGFSPVFVRPLNSNLGVYL